MNGEHRTDIALVRYTDVSEEEYLDYIGEWESQTGKVVPVQSERRSRSFAEMRKKWENDESDEAYANGFVPATLFFLVRGDRRILGAIHLRHQLNDRLRANGGHIGYGIRPSERRKGYGKKMLELLLSRLRERGLKKVMLTCDEDNIGSMKIIEGCGGVLQDKVVFKGTWTRRYWIDLA
jgi:predicted acetyltransferase